jgi:hypothetical protein
MTDPEADITILFQNIFSEGWEHDGTGGVYTFDKMGVRIVQTNSDYHFHFVGDDWSLLLKSGSTYREESKYIFHINETKYDFVAITFTGDHAKFQQDLVVLKMTTAMD